jgi:uncharacterized membrane protein
MMLKVEYPLTTNDVLIEFALLFLAGILVIWLIWRRIFAYSPDKRYRINRYTGVAEEQRMITYPPLPEAGGLIIWGPLGKVTGKQYILENWAQNNDVDIKAYIKEKTSHTLVEK